MMNFNVNAAFQAQIAQVASFFEGPKRRVDTDNAATKFKGRKKVADEFILTHPVVDVEETSADNDIHQNKHDPFQNFRRDKDGWR